MDAKKYIGYSSKKQNEVRSSEEELFKIRLYHEGGFYRAYEWSAFLCHTFNTNLPKEEQLKILMQKTKGIPDGIVYIGFPQNSIEKFLGIKKEEISTKLNEIEPNIYIYDISNIYKYKHLINIENYKDKFNDWKAKNDIYENSFKNKRKTFADKVMTNGKINTEVTEMFKEIVLFNVENKTVSELGDFIKTIKDKVLSIILQ